MQSAMRSLILVFAGRTSLIVGFVVRWLPANDTEKNSKQSNTDSTQAINQRKAKQPFLSSLTKWSQC